MEVFDTDRESAVCPGGGKAASQTYAGEEEEMMVMVGMVRMVMVRMVRRRVRAIIICLFETCLKYHDDLINAGEVVDDNGCSYDS